MKKFRVTDKGTQFEKIIGRDILNAWDNDVTLEGIKRQKKRLSRRIFLGQSLGLIAATAIPTFVSAKVNKLPTELTQPWLTLAKVQNHLFPRTGDINNQKSDKFSPGAKDINAIAYLLAMLEAPDSDQAERKFIMKGVGWLDGVANSLEKSAFIKLNKIQRERVLKKISESDAGETWISTLLRYIFEALLTDPVYGGNTNRMGWAWLEHQPGFPRPPENKKYWMLSKSVSNRSSK